MCYDNVVSWKDYTIVDGAANYNRRRRVSLAHLLAGGHTLPFSFVSNGGSLTA